MSCTAEQGSSAPLQIALNGLNIRENHVVTDFLPYWASYCSAMLEPLLCSVGTGAISTRKAIIAAVSFEVLGAILLGGPVAFRLNWFSIVEFLYERKPEIILLAYLSAAIAAGTLLQFTSFMEWRAPGS